MRGELGTRVSRMETAEDHSGGSRRPRMLLHRLPRTRLAHDLQTKMFIKKSKIFLNDEKEMFGKEDERQKKEFQLHFSARQSRSGRQSACSEP